LVIGSFTVFQISFFSGDAPGLRFISLEFLVDRGMQSLNVCLCLEVALVVVAQGDANLLIDSLLLDFEADEQIVDMSRV
jgi:hypothetical protein